MLAFLDFDLGVKFVGHLCFTLALISIWYLWQLMLDGDDR